MINAAFTLELPMPPSVNRLYIGTGKNKRRHPNYAAWFDEAGWRMNEAKARGAYSALPDDVWYWTDIRLPINHIGDSDNRIKALHDLLHNMGATPDDCLLLGGSYMRSKGILPGTCVVQARALPSVVEDAEQEIIFLAQRISAARTVEIRGEIT